MEFFYKYSAQRVCIMSVCSGFFKKKVILIQDEE